MEANELRKIKEYQRDYEKLFGKKLHIDWLAMKNIKAELMKVLKDTKLLQIKSKLLEI